MQNTKAFIPNRAAISFEKNSTKNYIESSEKKFQDESIFSFGKDIPIQTKDYVIDGELAKEMRSMIMEEDITVFATILGLLNVLFYRYRNQDDICIGFTLPYNKHTVGEMPALFHDLIPVQKLNSENSFIELLSEIKTATIKASEDNLHSYKTEKEKIINNKDPRLKESSQVMLIVEGMDDEFQFGLLQFSGEPLTLNLSKPELVFFIKEITSGFNCRIDYNTQLYKEDKVSSIANHFEELVVSIIKSRDEKISALNILTAAEKHQLLVEFNNTETAYPRDKTIVNLFEEQAIKIPGKFAVIFETQKRTYDELNKRANQVAWYLINRGVKKETLIPICIERSVDMLVGILGILKAGAAYVPIDPEYPEDRINYILKDTAATIVITSKISSPKIPASSTIDLIEINKEQSAIDNMPVQNPGADINSRNLAYVIYTSGSTGKPKGVMIEHQALIDHCFGLIKVAQLDTCTSFALFSPLVFDAGHSIIFTSLFLGASLNILSQQLIMDGEKLVSYLGKNPVDCIKIVPSVWLSYINADNKVLSKKVMIFGGETFSLKIQEHLIKLNYKGKVYNHYGPTEATIGKCIHKVDLQKAYKTVPIGKPFSNTQLYVVDKFDQLAPSGVAGELYIAGEGIARGYLNRPDLTAEKFITNPYSHKIQFESRLYKTGDKVKWNNDGEIEYLGRIDEQVKINGYRIELGEIENALLQNKKIRQAAVLLCEDNNHNKVLVGYIVPEEIFDKPQVISQLQEKLPEYMVPGFWVELDHLPLTPNGKIDKKALPIPDFSKFLNNQYEAPQNDTEAALVRIWGKLLGVDKVGVNDTFFELGGNSIQAVTMFTRVKKHFGKTLPLATIFQAPDIKKLAEIINQKKEFTNSSCLVTIQPEGTNPPLFCMHAGAGNVLFYKDLAKNLGSNQPLYGLMARGLNGKEHFHTSIEEMATHYIKEIKSVQPHGPYFLAGYCLGGTIAFEMSKQLLNEGEKIELLTTFNSRSSTYLNAPKKSSNTKKQSTALLPLTLAYAGNFSALNTKQKLLYPLKVIKIGSKLATNVLYKNSHRSLLRINNRLIKTGFNYYLSKGRLLPPWLRNKYMLHNNGHMSRVYEPGVYPGEMLVFRSPQLYNDPYLGWRNHVTGEIKSYDVPGNYKRRSEIMNDPFIKIISDKLKPILESSKSNPV